MGYDIGNKGGEIMDIGTKIKEARLSAQLTQEQAAEQLGVSRQTISKVRKQITMHAFIFTQ